ncbi:MAG: transposase, partial [Halieaceae bacterium]|nr:transposase [Halieaceae bacterium]
LLTALYGDAPSEPVILASVHRLAKRTQGSLAQIRQQLIAAPVVHFDESGMRVVERPPAPEALLPADPIPVLVGLT